MTMSFANQRLREFQYIINKLNELGLSEPRAHSHMWSFSTPNIENKVTYTTFI